MAPGAARVDADDRSETTTRALLPQRATVRTGMITNERTNHGRQTEFSSSSSRAGGGGEQRRTA